MMKFDDLDLKMRQYELAYDFCIPEGNYIIARLDGRGFTHLTKNIWQFEAPFDVRFRDLMAHTSASLLNCGFKILYAFSESDEISLLLASNELTFQRKIRKIITILASEASAQFSLKHGSVATFDGRVSVLPNLNLVEDYFSWRQEDAHRNALNAHCYWLKRKLGLSPESASRDLLTFTRQNKHDFLFEHGINFNDLPNWQKRGFGVYFQEKEKSGFNPVLNEETITSRKIIYQNFDLPIKEEYRLLIRNLIQE